MRRMARGGEQVLAAVSLLTVEIRVDLASTDTQGGVEEGDGVLCRWGRSSG